MSKRCVRARAHALFQAIDIELGIRLLRSSLSCCKNFQVTISPRIFMLEGMLGIAKKCSIIWFQDLSSTATTHRSYHETMRALGLGCFLLFCLFFRFSCKVLFFIPCWRRCSMLERSVGKCERILRESFLLPTFVIILYEIWETESFRSTNGCNSNYMYMYNTCVC